MPASSCWCGTSAGAASRPRSRHPRRLRPSSCSRSGSPAARSMKRSTGGGWRCCRALVRRPTAGPARVPGRARSDSCDASTLAVLDHLVRPGPAGPGTGPDPDKIVVMALRVDAHGNRPHPSVQCTFFRRLPGGFAYTLAGYRHKHIRIPLEGIGISLRVQGPNGPGPGGTTHRTPSCRKGVFPYRR